MLYYSNTALVKVKLAMAIPSFCLSSNSNTALVKVKSFNIAKKYLVETYSNTALVKVKFTFKYMG